MHARLILTQTELEKWANMANLHVYKSILSKLEFKKMWEKCVNAWGECAWGPWKEFIHQWGAEDTVRSLLHAYKSTN